MHEFTKEDRLHTQKLAEKFSNDTLGNVAPHGKCFTICYPLALHLRNNNINCEIVTGKFGNTTVDHFWLMLTDDSSIIVDPTIRQFYPDMPSVHVGKKPEDYNQCLDEDWFEQTCDAWIGPFLRKSKDKAPSELSLPFKDLLRINLTAATILNNEIEQLENNGCFKPSSASERYFTYIGEVLKKCLEMKELQQLILPPGFDKLLSKVK